MARRKKRKQAFWFTHIAKWASRTAGKPSTFMVALVIIFVWLLTGPIFHFSDTWQLVINTSTTIITFLMVFLIQSTQNRDQEALQIKLDEVLRSMENAHTVLLEARMTAECLKCRMCGTVILMVESTKGGEG